MNLTDGLTFPTTLIKRAKIRVTQKNIYHVTQSDAYRNFQYTMVGTHRFSRYCVKYVMKIFF